MHAVLHHWWVHCFPVACRVDVFEPACTDMVLQPLGSVLLLSHYCLVYLFVQ